ncbi:hypothetical protein EW026_g7903 [Hermanssonia centrifuga]|uniref:Uncharacterized protein n=1 Tax=Hermanssonia centrifuga TaxID=98765 RepID=A0A4S4K687_9APHY|nr:hypothetical protein EW026_g7903 [Hermanssonia centrifuga]
MTSTHITPASQLLPSAVTSKPAPSSTTPSAAPTPASQITVQPMKQLAKNQNPLTGEQKKLLTKERQRKQAEIDDDVDALFDQIEQRTKELGEKYGRKQRYFLDRIFNGGVKAVNGSKTSAFNAWAHFKCEQVNEDLPPHQAVPLLEVQERYINEYHQLTGEDKERLVHDFELIKETRKRGPRVTARGKIQDIVHTTKQMEELLSGLDSRVGIQALFCVVRSSSNFAMKPRWYFTSPDLERYLEIAVRKKFEAKQVGALMEAYAVAGGSVASVLRTSKMKADWFKALIRDKVTELLVEISGNEHANMQYLNYERDIVQKYHIKMVGWTHEKFVNVSELGNSLEPLEKLWNALKNGTCKFVKISSTEVATRQERTRQAVVAGEVAAPKQRKIRKDKGIAKGRRKRGNTKDGDNDKSSGGDSSSGSEGEGEEGRDGESSRKRAKRGARSHGVGRPRCFSAF